MSQEASLRGTGIERRFLLGESVSLSQRPHLMSYDVDLQVGDLCDVLESKPSVISWKYLVRSQHGGEYWVEQYMLERVEPVTPQIIYVAGPYGDHLPEEEREANTVRAIKAGVEIFRKGHVPKIPHLLHYVDRVLRTTGEHFQAADYMRWDAPDLHQSSGLFLLASSRGADAEHHIADLAGKRLYYCLSQIPRVEEGLESVSPV